MSYKDLMIAKTLRISFDKIEPFIRIYDGNRYLALFSLEKYDVLYNRIRHLITHKSGVINVLFYNIRRKSKLIPMITCL